MSESVLNTPKTAKNFSVIGILVAVSAAVLSLSNILTLINSAGYWVSSINNPGEYDQPAKLAPTLALYIVSVLLGFAIVFLSLTNKLQIARIILPILALLNPIAIAIIWGESPIDTLRYAFENIGGSGSSFNSFVWFIDYLVHPLILVPAIVLTILAFVLPKKRAVQEIAHTPASSAAVFNNNSTQTLVSESTTNKGNTNMAAQYEVMIPGITDPQVDVATLQAWARSGRIKANTLVKEISTGATFNASQIPGVFSDKQYTTALILSILLGTIGVDRFYTGHVGIGVGKLLTAGGCGVWALVDIILYATRKVTDSEGNPLS